MSSMADADPYAAPNTLLPTEARPRITHAIVAATAGSLAILGFCAYLAITRDVHFVFPKDLLAIVALALTALLTGLIILPFRTTRWYWAAILGPIMACPLFLIVVIAIELIRRTFFA
jgi:hypothetical protein